MKKQRSFLALLFCAALCFILFGCTQQAAETVPPTEIPTEPPVSDLYTQAAQPLRAASDLELELTTKKEITVGTETFNLVSDQELTFTGIGTDAFAAGLTEDLDINDTYDQFKEYYADGVLYVNIMDAYRFQGSLTYDAFMARFAPAVLLDETLYTSITAEENENGTIITFSSPTAAESWALPEGAEWISAGGTATISSDGSLSKSTYTIEYTQGGTRVVMEVSAKAGIPVTVDLTAPPEPTVYQEISCIEAPRLYDTAVMYLYSAGTASSTLTEVIVSQAAGYTLTEQTQVDFTGTGTAHAANIDYTVSAVDSTAATSTYTQTEHFENGIYTISADGGAAVESADVTAAIMLDYAQGCLGGDFLPALDYISGAEAEDVSGLVYLELELTEEYGDATNAYICSTLFEDEEYLNNFASAYATTDCHYYLVVDPVTGFPVSAGLQYSGTHTIDGADYILALQTNQAYQLCSESTYESITGEPLPEEAPDTQATPLLYRVTGPDGQEMYLMGTIHVGDERTAYLPDEVYAALNASDALAVEFDTIAFEEALANDDALAAQLSMAYINADGSATKDQLEEAVYDKAVKLLKASGGYNSGFEYMKPYLWSQSIDNFYLTLGKLSADKGMDSRLLKLAKDTGMEILEVESGLSQIQMFTNFSTELQVLLLEESVNTTAAEYCAEVEALYEMWCTGDEATLREQLAEDTSTLTDDERVLYEEYINAMLVSRNTAMLDVATSYLESGDTIFFAVGLMHLLQENGLVSTLREAGYTVEQISY